MRHVAWCEVVVRTCDAEGEFGDSAITSARGVASLLEATEGARRGGERVVVLSCLVLCCLVPAASEEGREERLLIWVLAWVLFTEARDTKAPVRGQGQKERESRKVFRRLRFHGNKRIKMRPDETRSLSREQRVESIEHRAESIEQRA
jgi:hypothetical protein